MRAELIAPADPRWANILSRTRHDFYHLPSYVTLAAELEGGEATALYIEDGELAWLLPLVRRALPGAVGFDLASPYGYPGPLRTSDTPAAVTYLWGELMPRAFAELQKSGAVTLFVRLHPLFDPPLEAMQRLGTVVDHGSTVSIDLRASLQESFFDFRTTYRNEIRRAEREGVRARRDEGFARLSDFTMLYAATMARLGASSYYLFPSRYFTALREALGERLSLWVVEHEGELAAAALFTECCGIVQYHLSASEPRLGRLSSTKVLLNAARRWAKERGNADLHLGGGVGSAEDSLFFFKAGFSPRRHVFRSFRVVLDEARYTELVRHAGGDAAVRTGFFPAYRQR